MNLVKHPGLLIVICLLGGCSLWPFKRAPSSATLPTRDKLINIHSAGLLAVQNGKPELGLILMNSSAQTLLVSVAFQTPGHRSDCLLTKELEPNREGAYFCSQPALQTEVDYPIHIDISNLAGDRIGVHDTRLRFDSQDLHAAQPNPDQEPPSGR